MNFVSLEALSGAAQAAAIGAGAAAVGLLVLMYFLKLKRVRREIPSTFLWKKSVEDMRANSPFQRLRRNLLLFLQLLILLAALFALARPALKSGAGTGATYIVLVDNSASMGATDVSPSRFAEAIRQVERIVADMNRGDSMMLMSFGAHPRVAVTVTNDKTALKAALADMTVTDGRTDVVEPLRLADALAKSAANPRIVVVSDGAFITPPVGLKLSAPVEFIGVGKGARNVGVTAMNVRRSVDDPTAGEIFANVTNYTDVEVRTVVTLSIDGELVDATTAAIGPLTSHAAVFKVRFDADRVAEVDVDYGDDLMSDNRAWAILEPHSDVEVTMVGQASPFLRKALAAGGRFKVRESSAEPAAGAPGSNLPVYVYDGSAPQSLAQAGYLIFNAVAPADGFKDEGAVENPVVIDTDTASPVTAMLDLGDIFIAKARKMSFPGETRVLVNSDETPLVTLSYCGGARVITVAFDPLDSRWPLRISYPIFVANAVNFLAGGSDTLSSRQFPVGDALVLAGEEGVDRVSITSPDGRVAEAPYQAGETVTFGDTSKAGIYIVRVGEAEIRYAANLTSSAESDIAPKRELAVGEAKVAAAEAAPKNRELWRELLVFAFVVLMIEWYVYNRRVYI